MSSKEQSPKLKIENDVRPPMPNPFDLFVMLAAVWPRKASDKSKTVKVQTPKAHE